MARWNANLGARMVYSIDIGGNFFKAELNGSVILAISLSLEALRVLSRESDGCEAVYSPIVGIQHSLIDILFYNTTTDNMIRVYQR